MFSISLLVTILIIALVAYVAFWIVDKMAMPNPMILIVPVSLIVKVIVGLLALFAILTQSGLL